MREDRDFRNPSFEIYPAKSLDIIPALELLFQHVPAEEAYTRSAKALPLLRGGGAGAPRLLLAEMDDEIAGVVLVQALVGGTGIVWPPQIAPDENNARVIEDALVQEAVAWLQQNGAKLAQSVLLAEEAAF